MDNHRKFGTTEIPLAGYLKYNGCKIVEIIKINEWKAEFIFEDVAKELIVDFNNDMSTVEPKMYAGVMRQLTQSARRVTTE